MATGTFLWGIFVLAVITNALSAAMFLARVWRPPLADPLGKLAIVMGLPALVLGVAGVLGDLGVAFWIFPLLYSAFALFALIVDVILEIEFRQPRRPAILVPFLILFYVPLIAMWGMLWTLGVTPWAIVGVAYFVMMGASFYALAKGVG